MTETKKNARKGLHLHRIHPIVLGGKADQKENVNFISRKEHAELATFWNRKLREGKNTK